VSVEGPLLFTHFGLSGPAALDLSLHLATTPAEVALSLLPDLSTAALEAQLVEQSAERGERLLGTALSELAPRRVAQEVIASLGIARHLEMGQLKKEWRQAVAARLTAAPLRVEQVRGWDEAMVAVGGCALEEIDPKTMMSRKVRGLHVVGELLDVAGPTGGFNLHAAFATGRLAARAILS